jgi:ABC-type Fe3+ transport system permease subunit
MTLSKYPLVFLPVAATLRNLDPSLEESARTLGQNRWGVFFRVTLPLLWPSLLAGALLIALHMLVEFGALSIIGLQTFTTAIYQQFELEFSNANAAMLSAVLLAMCLMLLWLELRVRGKVAMCASARARRVMPNRCDWAVGIGPVVLPGAGDCRQRYSAGHARVLAGGGLVGGVPGGRDR